MAMTGVLRPGHISIRVLDMEAAPGHYIEVLGLIQTGRDERGRVYLKAWDEHDHHGVVITRTNRRSRGRWTAWAKRFSITIGS